MQIVTYRMHEPLAFSFIYVPLYCKSGFLYPLLCLCFSGTAIGQLNCRLFGNCRHHKFC